MMHQAVHHPNRAGGPTSHGDSRGHKKNGTGFLFLFGLVLFTPIMPALGMFGAPLPPAAGMLGGVSTTTPSQERDDAQQPLLLQTWGSSYPELLPSQEEPSFSPPPRDSDVFMEARSPTAGEQGGSSPARKMSRSGSSSRSLASCGPLAEDAARRLASSSEARRPPLGEAQQGPGVRVGNLFPFDIHNPPSAEDPFLVSISKALQAAAAIAPSPSTTSVVELHAALREVGFLVDKSEDWPGLVIMLREFLAHNDWQQALEQYEVGSFCSYGGRRWRSERKKLLWKRGFIVQRSTSTRGVGRRGTNYCAPVVISGEDDVVGRGCRGK